MRIGTVVIAVIVAILGTSCLADAAETETRYEDTSADGSVVFFTTTDPLVNGDTDTRRDVFMRSKDSSIGEFVTRLVSTGPIGGNQAYDATFAASSSDGTKVFFSTSERLVPEDGDTASDLYLRDLDENTTALISRADAVCSGTCGNDDDGNVAGARLAAGDTKVFFSTSESLSDLDGDSAADIYMRDLNVPNATVLVSRGEISCTGATCGGGVFLRDVSDDGEVAFLSTSEELVSADNDEAPDIYVRDLVAETTELVSIEGECPALLTQGQCNPAFGGASQDGSHAFFETRERLSGADTDEAADVYDWTGGGLTLASIGPDGGNGLLNHVTYAGSSPDGNSVFFQTDEKLVVPDDEDTVQDVYERRGGTVTELISTGPQSGVASPASMDPNLGVVSQGAGLGAIFVTAETLVASDQDIRSDVYLRTAGETILISHGASECQPSCGNGEFNANIAATSANGGHLLFVTSEQLATADTDSVQDIYEWSAGVTTLVSRGPAGGNGPFPTKRVAVAASGSKAFFETAERLTSDDDFAEKDDVYGRSEGETQLESQGNGDLIIGPPAPALQTTNPVSPGPSTSPKIIGQAAAGTEVKLYTSANCSGEQAHDPNGQPAGGSGEELVSGGIAVAVALGATVTFYATAEAEGIVSPCSKGITYKQETSVPAPPPPGEGGSGGGTSITPGSGSPVDQSKPHNGGITFVMPETQITFGPGFKTRKRTVVFRFLDATGQSGTRFHCRVDRHSWRSCGSPMRLKKLSRGKHVFSVKAENAIGVWEVKPAKRRFKVVRG